MTTEQPHSSPSSRPTSSRPTSKPSPPIPLEDFDAFIFDLDGVVTETASLHFEAWKASFDAFLERHVGDGVRLFDKQDYLHYVDGKPRYEGVASFLASRDIELPLGAEDDPGDLATVHGIGNDKNARYQKFLEKGEIPTFPSTIELIERLRKQGIKTAMVSSSKNARTVLKVTGLEELFDVCVDGKDLLRRGLKGKPEPDMFLQAAEDLGVEPGRAVVVEDAVSGVEAGRAGDFALVVGVARPGTSPERLLEHGADVVVDDLARLRIREPVQPTVLPDARTFLDHLVTNELALFLNFDSCLCPTSAKQDQAELTERERRAVKELARICSLTVVSSRDVEDLRHRVGIEGVQYVGSHGFEIVDAYGHRIDQRHGEAMVPDLALAALALRKSLAGLEGVWLEKKAFSLSIHRPHAQPRTLVEVDAIVDAVLANHPLLTSFEGVDATHIIPDVDWNEGRALEWLINELEKCRPALTPLYIGTLPGGQEVFRRLRYRGICVAVGEGAHDSLAHFHLPDVEAVIDFLTLLVPRQRRLTDEGSWVIRYERFEPAHEGVRETLTTLGNGYFTTRGAAPESEANAIHYPGTYVAGTYNRLVSHRAGRSVSNEDLVNFPNWLLLQFRIDEQEWFSLNESDILAYAQELDLKRGVLRRTVRFRDKVGRTSRLTHSRLVHAEDVHIGALHMELVAEDWGGTVEVRSALDGRVVNDNVWRYQGLQKKHLEVLEMGEATPEMVYLRVRTSQSRIELAQAMRTRIFYGDQAVDPPRAYISDPGGIVGHQFRVKVEPGVRLRVEKVVTLYTSRDRGISECVENALKHLRRAPDYVTLLQSHIRAWNHLWRHFEIGLTASQPLSNGQSAGLILRLHVFHLIQTVSPHTYDLDVGIPARGWHGEAYRGHVFWDELFIFPLLNMRAPEITRALLLYRYRRLEEARARAKEAGFKGAMYPWQSGSDGREETPLAHYEPDEGEWRRELTWMQQHINAAVVYNIWRYYQVTDDTEFLRSYGSEIVFEIARFFSSFAHYDGEEERYEIRDIVGPDEYHDTYPGLDKPGLRNNAYTNVMVVWVMCRALELLDLLPHGRVRELFEKLDIDHDEVERWKDISHRLRLNVTDDGLIMQFDGYESLEEFDWQGYREKHGDLQKIDRAFFFETDKTLNDYKVSKQADVLMLFYLFSRRELETIFERLGYEIDDAMIQHNIDYYMERTTHGSTLSRIVHTWVLCECDPARAWELFSEAMLSDVGDIQGGTTAEGIHLGAMAGTVDIVERSFAGIQIYEDILFFCPNLPEEIERLDLHIRYRGQAIAISLETDSLRVTTGGNPVAPVRVGFAEEIVEMPPFSCHTFSLIGHQGCILPHAPH